MGLWLKCPDCQITNHLSLRVCPQCGRSLDNLPPELRVYVIGAHAAAVPEVPAAPEPAVAAAPEPVAAAVVAPPAPPAAAAPKPVKPAKKSRKKKS
jgi:hypothetical protein